MNSRIKAVVVDDQINAFLSDLNSSLPDLQFTGCESFDLDDVLRRLDQESPTVLLLDIVGENGEPGLDLFEALERDIRWQRKSGSVQIVFFSQEATARRHNRVALARSPHVAGFLRKEDVFDGGQTAIASLSAAHHRALRCKAYPSLADPIRRECELLFSPNSQVMGQVWESTLLAADCWEPVLIQGETGTGKELVAQAISTVMQEKQKARPGQPLPPGAGGMLAHNIGSGPTEGNLQYTELFGSLKGAHSAADKDRIGVFERAGGQDEHGKPQNKTLFLDEIGDAPPIIQVAMLRVLQEKRIIPLGGFAGSGEVERAVESFRLVTASHRDLPERVKEGRFRADLYYRLNTIEIHMPPLRERLDDIRVLVYYFIDKLNEQYGPYGKSKRLNPDHEDAIMDRLCAYDWPGNVRELEMLIRRSYVMSPGQEFQLSEDIDRLLEGADPAPPRSAGDIAASLAKFPHSLPTLKRMYGEPTAIEVARLTVEHLGRHPTQEQAKRLFGMKQDAARKWLQDHGIPSPRTRRSHAAEEAG